MRKRNKYVWIISLICCGLSVYLPAQQPPAHELYTVKEGLSENVIHSLYQDKKGFLWIGTHEGLNRFDGYSFKKYLYDKRNNFSLPNSPIAQMLEDETGDLYIMSSYGLTKMDKSSGQFTIQQKDLRRSYYPTFQSLALSFPASTYLQIDPCWYIREHIPVSKQQWDFVRGRSFNEGFFDKRKQLWLFDKVSIRRIDSAGNEQMILTGLEWNNKPSGLNLLSEDSNGNFWVRTEGNLYCIDGLTGKIKTAITQAQLGDFPMENIQALLLDRSGILWIGSFYGLRKINLDYQPFRHFIYHDKLKGLASNFVLGLNIHDGNKLAVQHYFMDSLYSIANLSSGMIQQVRIDKVPSEKFLREALIHHVDRISPQDWKWQLQKIKDSSINLRNLRYAYADHSGVIWSFYDQERLMNFRDQRTVEIKGSAEAIWDDGKYLWIASTSNGLFRYELLTGETKNYRSGAGEKNLSTDNLLCFTPDAKGNLWIGTRGGGLNHFDKVTETFKRYSEEEGLGGTTIYCMAMDNEDQVWMGTSKGLSCFDPVSASFRNFYTADGLVNTEFNRWSAVKDEKGLLYFGGMNGIDYFDPNELLAIKQPSTHVHLTAFKTGNESQPLQQGLVLGHKQNFISFEFAAMNFRNPAATQYRYMLEGASDEWINTEANHTAVFASLGPGRYIFKVKAAMQNGIWGPEERMAFSIRAPWWQQAWFFIVLALIVTVILYGIYRFRINQLRKLYQVRTKISQDLHDEVGATLTSISFLSEVAHKQTSTANTAAVATINKIGEYSRDMIGEMNDIVWAINPANDRFEKIEDRIRNFAMPLLSARNIQFDLHTDEQLKQVTLDMQQRKNLYLIFKEAVNNAAKYAECDKVHVRMIRENGQVQLEITDNGKGFDGSVVQAGNGLVNMQQRAKEIKGRIEIRSEPGQGTRIFLVMPLTQNA